METLTADKNVAISLRIALLVASGKDVQDAVNEVLGEGAYERLASDLYDALRAKVAR